MTHEWLILVGGLMVMGPLIWVAQDCFREVHHNDLTWRKIEIRVGAIIAPGYALLCIGVCKAFLTH